MHRRLPTPASLQSPPPAVCSPRHRRRGSRPAGLRGAPGAAAGQRRHRAPGRRRSSPAATDGATSRRPGRSVVNYPGSVSHDVAPPSSCRRAYERRRRHGHARHIARRRGATCDVVVLVSTPRLRADARARPAASQSDADARHGRRRRAPGRSARPSNRRRPRTTDGWPAPRATTLATASTRYSPSPWQATPTAARRPARWAPDRSRAEQRGPTAPRGDMHSFPSSRTLPPPPRRARRGGVAHAAEHLVDRSRRHDVAGRRTRLDGGEVDPRPHDSTARSASSLRNRATACSLRSRSSDPSASRVSRCASTASHSSASPAPVTRRRLDARRAPTPGAAGAGGAGRGGSRRPLGAPAPARSPSAFVTTTMSASSMTPRLTPCSSSPAPPLTSSTKVSTRSATATSDWPTPTVSTRTTSKPAASHSSSASAVRRATPPRSPRDGVGRMNACGVAGQLGHAGLVAEDRAAGAARRRVDGEHRQRRPAPRRCAGRAPR